MISDHLNHNVRMEVCIDCVNKNKLKYISKKASELNCIVQYIFDLINEMSTVCENVDNLKQV